MIVDRHQRPLRNLRLSVTDRCNLRCSYCMPEAEYAWLPREDILRFEEISRLVDVFIGLGVDKVRLTGGEPLLRKDLHALVAQLAAKPGLTDLALTTNGILLDDQADALRRAGLHRVTVSLDTLNRERFQALTRADELARVHAGIDRAATAFPQLKIDTVLIKGTNDDEVVDILEFGRARGAEVRFIEYMDVGGATRWSMDRVVTKNELLHQLAAHYGEVAPVVEDSSAPAVRYRLPDGTVFGIIASTTAPFCTSCDRSRLTADGMWYLCLYAQQGLDLRKALRAGVPGAELQALLEHAWTARTDRGAEQRLRTGARSAFIGVDSLRQDPHLEMHTRGG